MMEFLRHIEFPYSDYFLWIFLISSLLFLGFLVFWRFWRGRYQYPTLRLPILAGVQAHLQPVRGMIKKNLWILRLLALAFLLVALARPRTALNEENIETEGIDIVLSLDISTSMDARDFSPNRLTVAKEKALEFISQRPNDRIGLVVFAGESYTQCPLTPDTAMVKKLLQEVKQGLIQDGTAIGMGLATAVLRLKESEAESKVVILLTDGVNNSGQIDPATAIQTAKQFGVRVYTIGVGRNGMAPFAVQNGLGQTVIVQQEVELDEQLLQQIAEETGGRYFQAVNEQALEKVYTEIDELEKTRIEVTRITRYTEEFYWFVMLAGICFLLEIVLRYAVVPSIP